MEFRTALTPTRPSWSISHRDGLFLMGSCFTENIGARLEALKFDALLNPNGIVYNPISMANSLQRLAAGDKPYGPESLFMHEGLWHSWAHHSDFSNPNREEALHLMNQSYHHAANRLNNCNRLLLTLGSATVFQRVENGEIVANNHKMPASTFRQRRLTVAEITAALQPCLEVIHDRNPGLQVILGVSPIRHIRQGLIENQRSKAVLLLACESLCQALPFVGYFPAYELLVDDLRDYRFYTDDLIHPSEMAVEYIWNFFAASFFDATTTALNQRIHKIVKAAQHRPFHPHTPEHQAFCKRQMEQIEVLLAAHPTLNFEQEIQHFRQYATHS